MDGKQWIIENWADVLAWVLAFLSYFLYLLKRFINSFKYFVIIYRFKALLF